MVLLQAPKSLAANDFSLWARLNHESSDIDGNEFCETVKSVCLGSKVNSVAVLISS